MALFERSVVSIKSDLLAFIVALSSLCGGFFIEIYECRLKELLLEECNKKKTRTKSFLC
jgi:hypothetical protein